MEALVFVGLFLALALASLRWGADSRPRPSSKEEQLAVYGLTWSHRPGAFISPAARPETGRPWRRAAAAQLLTTPPLPLVATGACANGLLGCGDRDGAAS